MFIAHGEKFRKNARWIMAGVLLLIIPSFIALFTTTGSSQRKTAGDLPTIGGKPIDPGEYQQARNTISLLVALSSGRESRHTPEVEDRITQDAVVRLVMLRKAKELGIHISDGEVSRQVEQEPIFRNDQSQFDYYRYTAIIGRFGLKARDYEEMTREQLTISRLQDLVAAGATASPLEVNLTYTPLHERLTIEMAQFNVADYKEPVSVSNEEAQAFYEQNKETFRTPAQASVRYAQFSAEDAKKTVKLTDEEVKEFYERNKPHYMGTNSVAPPLDTIKTKVEDELLALRADRVAGDRATEFSVRLVAKPGTPRPDFTAVCKEFGIEPKVTGFFTQFDKPLGTTGTVAFVQQAFALTPDAPTSDPIPGPDGYYVLEYVDGKPSDIPTFEKMKDKVVDQIKRMRIYDATVRRGQETVTQLKKLVVDGKGFAAACAKLKLKVETPEPFLVSDEKLKLPAAQRIQTESVAMPVGAVSEFIPTVRGGVVFHLKGRQPPDPAMVEEDRPTWTRRILQQNRQALLQAWIGNLIHEQQVTFGRPRSRPAEAAQPESETAPTPAPAQS